MPTNRIWKSCLLTLMAAAMCAPAMSQAKEPSRKKGCCVVVGKNGKWARHTAALNAKWFYSWGADVPKGLDADLEFVPMIWGPHKAQESSALTLLAQQAKQGQVKSLMGFNEPDQANQSNMTVEEAIRLWPKLMETGLPLASPGCVHPDRQWMQEFMKAADERGLRVDYVCVHSYGGPNAKALVERLRRVHEMYGRPIWITEFAVGDWQAKTAAENKHSPQKVAEFMRELLPMLEELDFVDRYAWFSASTKSAALGTSALFNEDGSLTELGQIYSEF